MKQTTVAIFTNEGIKCVKLFKNVNNVKQILTMSEAEAVIKVFFITIYSCGLMSLL